MPAIARPPNTTTQNIDRPERKICTPKIDDITNDMPKSGWSINSVIRMPNSAIARRWPGKSF